jgi:hypothetical protein
MKPRTSTQSTAEQYVGKLRPGDYIVPLGRRRTSVGYVEDVGYVEEVEMRPDGWQVLIVLRYNTKSRYWRITPVKYLVKPDGTSAFGWRRLANPPVRINLAEIHRRREKGRKSLAH